jgi:hypothetical protein
MLTIYLSKYICLNKNSIFIKKIDEDFSEKTHQVI